MAVHTLKTWPADFKPIIGGEKTCEFRRNDRNFQVNDHLILKEWRPPKTKKGRGMFTGRAVTRHVTHIVHGPAYGIPEGFVIMSIA